MPHREAALKPKPAAGCRAQLVGGDPRRPGNGNSILKPVYRPSLYTNPSRCPQVGHLSVRGSNPQRPLLQRPSYGQAATTVTGKSSLNKQGRTNLRRAGLNAHFRRQSSQGAFSPPLHYMHLRLCVKSNLAAPERGLSAVAFGTPGVEAVVLQNALRTV